eukprot:Opistho-1_new@28841
MGASPSALRPADVEGHAALARIAGTAPVRADDATLWDRVLATPLPRIATSDDVRAVESAAANLLKQFGSNFAASGNLAVLVDVAVAEASACLLHKGSVSLARTRAAVVLVRTALRYLAAADTAAVITALGADAPKGLPVAAEGVAASAIPRPDSHGIDLTALVAPGAASPPPSPAPRLNRAQLLLTALMDLIIATEVTADTGALVLEAADCLLVLLGTQVYGASADANPIVATAMGVGNARASSLVRTCLTLFVERPPPPEEASGDIFSSIGWAASSLFSMPVTAVSYLFTRRGSDVEGPAPSPVAERALMLLLVLSNHWRAGSPKGKGVGNPFAAALADFRDTHVFDGEEDERPPFRMAFASLYAALCRAPPVLLLYDLLHGNDAFLSFVLSRTDIEALVVPILRLLYRAPELDSQQVYLLLIVLLILTQDKPFCAGVHGIVLPTASWLTERLVSDISLGSAIVVVLVRTVQYNLAKTRDVYLHTNCLAALANLSGHVKGLHPYAAQRMASLFDMLARKFNRLQQQRAVRDQEDTELAMYADFVRIVLEILNACLLHGLQHNPHLLYTLLYKRGMFEPFARDPRFEDIVSNIDTVLSYFASRVDDVAKHSVSVDVVMATIERAALQFPLARLKRFPELKFKYEEEESPDDFFVPHVWSQVHAAGWYGWSAEKIQLFAPAQPQPQPLA